MLILRVDVQDVFRVIPNPLNFCCFIFVLPYVNPYHTLSMSLNRVKSSTFITHHNHLCSCTCIIKLSLNNRKDC